RGSTSTRTKQSLPWKTPSPSPESGGSGHGLSAADDGDVVKVLFGGHSRSFMISVLRRVLATVAGAPFLEHRSRARFCRADSGPAPRCALYRSGGAKRLRQARDT